MGCGKTRPARSAREVHVARFARQIGALGRAGRLASIANGPGVEEDGCVLTVEIVLGGISLPTPD